MGPNNSVEQEGWGLLNCDAPIDRVAVVCAALVIFANRTIEAGEELGFPRHPKILDSKKAGTDYAQVRGSTTTDTSRSGNGVLLGGCGVVVAPPLAGMSRCTTDAPKYVIRRELATRPCSDLSELRVEKFDGTQQQCGVGMSGRAGARLIL